MQQLCLFNKRRVKLEYPAKVGSPGGSSFRPSLAQKGPDRFGLKGPRPVAFTWRMPSVTPRGEAEAGGGQLRSVASSALCEVRLFLGLPLGGRDEAIGYTVSEMVRLSHRSFAGVHWPRHCRCLGKAHR